MKIIIIKPFQNYKVNEIVEVTDGYAKNFLIKKGYAHPLNNMTMNSLERVKQKLDLQLQEEIDRANETKNKIENLTLNFGLKTNGFIVHGSITNTAILKELNKHGVQIQKKCILADAINTLGMHEVKIKLHEKVLATLKVKVEEL
ncbi:50S ribosomal protein L9 [Metamycoplasma hyosynoviae]|uniref:Large ribosomal subunit protein bL9 n=1 Tax=Metamycoplasma hyosynoviae TaxID=29559 RepID=A0A063Y7W9_9BACT|nr:50S ribosomal protein L9 [Metamycoplasma hyosynoviae]KDE41814.1 50S ribosomal protein L9 [Metamycoplasma hyosynoviae]KDE42072.1 50S ribosomal protein L9 [Metamycoplasma hyosynoviae]KDE42815.1 50S ribosomal protein L9 [Metamycoplasma hyosynoviae]KDE44241.1 50S ribosomal protein L9 [Metamycoplasma hyosynoviae]KDE44932.1 50S ribosomal protein L9 [Metamycoplasma hyosynoviae]